MIRWKSKPLSRAAVLVSGLALGPLSCGSQSEPAELTAGSAGTGGSGGSGASSGGSGANGGTAGTGSGNAGSSAQGGSSAGGAGGSAPVVDCNAVPSAKITISWSSIDTQPEAFYATPQALALAENILYYQNDDHGWPKDTDMTSREKPKTRSTIDNRATTTQILYLARVFGATGCQKYGDAAASGIAYLLEAQYENGGWPQEYPDPQGYHAHITFNDDAMVHVLELLRSVSKKTAPYGFVDDETATRAAQAVELGVECILNTQIVIEGQKLAWCAQHDEITLEPAQARSYELPSLSGSEGVGIVRFLMSIEEPSPAVREAIEAAVAWFEAVKLTGIRVVKTEDPSQPTGEDRVVVEDASAPPIWARFYELGSNRPIFSSRCEVPECEADPFYMRRYSLAEIENERRVGYAWYGDWPAKLLASDYPAWKARFPDP